MVEERDGKAGPRFPSLEGHIHPTYTRVRRSDYTDLERAEDWIQEFKQFEQEGRVPRFPLLALPDDHSWGTRPGNYTPAASVGRNDDCRRWGALWRRHRAVRCGARWPSLWWWTMPKMDSTMWMRTVPWHW